MADTRDVLNLARSLVSAKRYEISEHVVRSITGGGLKIQEIENVIIKGEIIEIHSNPMRGRSFLVLGYSQKKPIHVMFTEIRDGLLLIILSDYPSPQIWKDPEKRFSQGDNAVNKVHRKCFFCGEKMKDITVGNFDYRLEGQLYVIKDVPAGLCLGCGEKYVSANTAKRIEDLIAQGETDSREEVLVFKLE